MHRGLRLKERNETRNNFDFTKEILYLVKFNLECSLTQTVGGWYTNSLAPNVLLNKDLVRE